MCHNYSYLPLISLSLSLSLGLNLQSNLPLHGQQPIYDSIKILGILLQLCRYYNKEIMYRHILSLVLPPRRCLKMQYLQCLKDRMSLQKIIKISPKEELSRNQIIYFSQCCIFPSYTKELNWNTRSTSKSQPWTFTIHICITHICNIR